MKSKITTPSVYKLAIGLLCSLFLCINISIAQDNEKEWEDFDPKNFDENSIHITNPWMTLKPGTRHLYSGTTHDDDGNPQPHRVIINVTDLTKVINGVNTLASWDLDYSNGELVEAELAFFAQDKKGNVWRMGEYPEEYEDGEFADAPCWMGGIKDAIPGISMLANPWEGTPSYSQGWGPKVGFTDRGQVHKMGLKVVVPMGSYDNVMIISETSKEEVGIFQHKYWAEGAGNIQVGFQGDDPSAEILRLVDIIELKGEMMDDLRANALKLEASAYERSKKVYGKTPPCVPIPKDHVALKGKKK